MLSPAITSRLHEIGDIVALKMRRGGDIVLAYLRIDAVELPNNLRNFSMGAATGLAQAGTGWNEIENSSGDEYPEPEEEEVLFQAFYGISPSYARLYRQYPSGTDRGSILRTRVPGTDAIGYLDGVDTPFLHPSPVSEFYTIKGLWPAFYGYHPYAEPASITVFLNLYIATYAVTNLGNSVTEEEKKRAKIVTMGGRTLVQAPQWLRD